eukprot:scaffold10021_cov102-Skeletonema_marinoi.AAC.1
MILLAKILSHYIPAQHFTSPRGIGRDDPAHSKWRSTNFNKDKVSNPSSTSFLRKIGVAP